MRGGHAQGGTPGPVDEAGREREVAGAQRARRDEGLVGLDQVPRAAVLRIRLWASTTRALAQTGVEDLAGLGPRGEQG